MILEPILLLQELKGGEAQSLKTEVILNKCLYINATAFRLAKYHNIYTGTKRGSRNKKRCDKNKIKKRKTEIFLN